MADIPEDAITKLLADGNGANVLLPQAGGEFLRLSYLWGKLRVDRTDKDGKILLPARRGGGSAIPTTPAD